MHSKPLLSIALLLAALLCAPPTLADPGADGRELLAHKGCLACHSLDGSASMGPSLQGILDRSSEEQVRRSITDPGAEAAEGYVAGGMPTIPLTDVELDAILAALGEPVPEGELPAPGSIASLALGAGLFAGLHLLLSSGWLRPRLVRALGESNFTWLYTIVAIATLTWAWYAWEAAPYVELWPALPWTRWIPNLGMPLVCILVVCGYTTDSPTIAGKGESLGKEGLASGVLRITRHPANVGFTLWGLLHLPPNGDLATVLLISPVLILGIFGTWHIERRRQARHGEAWTAYARETSIVPFAAILRGAQHLSLREIGWARTLGGLAVWAGLLLTHHLFVGVLPYPNL